MQKYEDFKIETGGECYNQLKTYLPNHGYRLGGEELLPGFFNWQGDRLNIWPVNSDHKIIIDWFGNEVEKIFNAQKKNIKEAVIKDNRIIAEDGVIEPEGYVVHPQFGVARFEGRRLRKYDNKLKKFILLEFAANDQLYFPAERENELMPYYGRKNPRLTRLYSKSWEKTKQRITEDLYAIARDLIVTAASRAVVKRDPYAESEQWSKILAASFPHTLTPDQERAIFEVQHDLTQSDRPMDRLLTGDVGYGKTEVAMRAALTVLAGGKKVLLLAPTTVLVEQHYDVWSARFAELPVNVCRVSRVQSNWSPAADLIIGTHKLFTLNILMEEVGLIIIDEEQRFGVKHKEHFKSLRSQLDVLSVTATPIPRTLYLGLSGLRSMSSIRTAPGQRKGVETVVKPFSAVTVKEAIEQEVKRGGQVYYVHNRVRSLPRVVRKLKDLLRPQYRLSSQKRGKRTLRYAVAHGQTPVNQLAAIMHAFFKGEIDILITTSIVENGLDNPNANTLIVERAELFGLADLYQLRGRVGRKDKLAYAYLLIGEREIKQQKLLASIALERLETIADSDKLGDGWSIALKDLEIRGAGTLLGKRQHGNMEAIGLVLYGRLLKRAVEEVRNASSGVHLTDDMIRLWKNK